MAMEKINNGSLLPKGMLDKFAGPDRARTARGTPQGLDSEAGKATQARPADSADISPRARELMDLRMAVDAGRRAMEALSDIREDKVALARERIRQGFYQSPAVREKIAENLGPVFRGMDDL